MKTVYTEYLKNREVRFTTSPVVAEDWPPMHREPRVEILSDGRAWLYHGLDGVWAWSIIGNFDEAMRRMMEEA